jgi:phosphatidylglycerol:prolipoprotein diacylglycerol transferase
MPVFPFDLTMGMMLSTPMVLIGAWLVWRGLREPLPPAIALEEAHLAGEGTSAATNESA